MSGPVVRSIPYRDPVTAFAPLAATSMAVLLDSALPTAQGCFSYIAADPRHVLQADSLTGIVTRDGLGCDVDPFGAVAEALGPRRSNANLPAPFGGGAIGWFAYELGGVLEHLPRPRDRVLTADMVVGIYDCVAAFDHSRRAAWIVAQGDNAAARADALAQRLGTGALSTVPPADAVLWEQETGRDAYEATVRAAIDFIRAGDIFQANITQRFIAATPPDLDWFGLYRRLRQNTPAPFGAFFHGPDGMHLLSASPERFLTVTGAGHVETRPIKGTRPRDPDPAKDRALADELLASAKDRAENLMIVDLLRNDLARVCIPGSVAVPVLQALETFPAVHHLVSVVTGHLRADASAIDLLRACFPGGSVTGAPKIRAMEVIRALETGARGPYCGALAWIGFDGAMDSSIVIRSLVGDSRRVFAQAGGGIVADSDPALEYAESLTKVAPLLRALSTRAPQ